ncbi:unnamed protein product [Gadus morhua 'NCC']
MGRVAEKERTCGSGDCRLVASPQGNSDHGEPRSERERSELTHSRAQEQSATPARRVHYRSYPSADFFLSTLGPPAVHYGPWRAGGG